MASTRPKSPIEAAADRLREIALGATEGVLIGSEDDLVEKLGVSRVTVRQAARLLEREGVLRVRRGINGGYFAARPSEDMVESVVLAYLDTLGIENSHCGTVTTALWVEVMHEAASVGGQAARNLAERLRAWIEAVPGNVPFREIGRLEQACRSAVFELIDGRYVELLFRINSAFARQRVPMDVQMADPMAGEEFVRDWKRAKLMEIAAIADADPVMAVLAARHGRNLWMARGTS